MGHIFSNLFNSPQFFFGDSHALSIIDLINLIGAHELHIGQINFSQGSFMEDTDHVDPSSSTSQEALLSSSSATEFMHFVLNGGAGYLDPGVEEEINAARVALANVGISWRELLETLRDEGTSDTDEVMK